MTSTPTQTGFYMPAEWQAHAGTWLQWPHDDAHPGTQVRLEHVIWLSGAPRDFCGVEGLPHRMHRVVPQEAR